MYSLKSKAIVYYTRITGQEIPKMVKVQDRQVDFDGLRFDLLPDRQRLHWKSILGVFGSWVIAYHLMWYARYPEDPKLYNVPIKSPAGNKLLNRSAQYKAYHVAESQRDTGKKKGGLMQYLPWFLVVIVLIFIIYEILTMSKNMAYFNTTLTGIQNTLAGK
jgi:hypothetical protein